MRLGLIPAAFMAMYLSTLGVNAEETKDKDNTEQVQKPLTYGQITSQNLIERGVENLTKEEVGKICTISSSEIDLRVKELKEQVSAAPEAYLSTCYTAMNSGNIAGSILETGTPYEILESDSLAKEEYFVGLVNWRESMIACTVLEQTAKTDPALGEYFSTPASEEMSIMGTLDDALERCSEIKAENTQYDLVQMPAE